MKILATICSFALCALVAGPAHGDASWTYENSTTTGTNGLGPYYGTSSDLLVTGGTGVGASTMLLNPAAGATTVSAIIDFGGPSGNENFLHVSSSSQDIQNSRLQFDLVTTTAVVINSLSYDAIVYHVNQGPGSITWTYSIDGGATQDFQDPVIDTFSNQGSWQTYNPAFSLVTSGAATIHIYGTIGTLASQEGNNNGEIGFDDFNFKIIPVPEPGTMILLPLGLLVLGGMTRWTHWKNHRRI